jgi:small subunit ribosomal protein S18
MPKNIGEDPYKNPVTQCIFCKYNIPLDYKNVQLLSQFVSPNTGIIYSQQVTGLCHYKYNELNNVIIKARRLGLMPFFYKESVYTQDPVLFNSSKNILRDIPNNYDQRKLNSDDV